MTNSEDINKEVIRLLKAGKYLKAIIYYKEQAGVSLKKAKEYVDSLARRQNLSHVKAKFEESKIWRKAFLGFIFLNILLFIAFIIGLNIINSLEYMENLFGFSEWEADEFRAKLLQEVYLIPLIIAIEIFLFSFLSIKSKGVKSLSKSYMIFIAVVFIIAGSFSYFLKSEKNRFKNPEKMEVIFNELKDKRIFKNKEINVYDMNFYVGNVDRQSNIYIFSNINGNTYTYRPYSLFNNWSKYKVQLSSRKYQSIELDKLNIEKIIPKVFETSEKIIKEKNLSHKYKGVNMINLEYREITDKKDWYWNSSIKERGSKNNHLYIIFDLEGNMVKIND